MEVNNQIAELNSEAGETAVQKLEEEIRVCKNMIKCTVCSDRPKEVKHKPTYPTTVLAFMVVK